MLARERALETLSSERFDVVVIGGGITGAGVALDAATRGYSVALVEKADFASGTSSRSSKLVHGGLRYLQQFDLGPGPRGAARAPADGQARAASGPAAEDGRAGVRRSAPGPAGGHRAEHVRRDGYSPAARATWLAAGRERQRIRPGLRVEPRTPPADLRRGGGRAAAGARTARAERAVISSTTVRPTMPAWCSRSWPRPSDSDRSVPTGSRSRT